MADDTTFEFLPLTLNVTTLGGRAEPLVRRGTPLPTRRTQRFSTAEDDQTAVTVVVCLGENPLAEKNMFVAKCELTEIPKAPRGSPDINVTFEVDKQCRIKITAEEKKSGTVICSEVEETGARLTPAAVDEMILKANEARKEDEAEAQRIDARNKACQAISRAEQYLQDQQKHGLSNATDRQIEVTIADLGLSLHDDNTGAIKDKTNRLQQLTPGTGMASFEDLFGSFLKASAGRIKTPAASADTHAKQTSHPSPSTNKEPSPSAEIVENRKGLFAAGQYFDAKCVVRDLFAQATHEIVVIDAYIGEDVLNLLTVKREGVAIKVLTGKVSPAFLTLARDFNRQYKGLDVRSSKAFHDRFVIVDEKDYYHFGASLEHLGNKGFMFSRIEEPAMTSALKKRISHEGLSGGGFSDTKASVIDCDFRAHPPCHSVQSSNP